VISRMTSDRISGKQGSIKPEETITDIVRKVAKNRETNVQAPMRAAANAALIRWLKEVESSESEQDQAWLDVALASHGFDSVNELAAAMMDSGEPIMAGATLDISDIDPEKLNIASSMGDSDGG